MAERNGSNTYGSSGAEALDLVPQPKGANVAGPLISSCRRMDGLAVLNQLARPSVTAVIV